MTQESIELGKTKKVEVKRLPEVKRLLNISIPDIARLVENKELTLVSSSNGGPISLSDYITIDSISKLAEEAIIKHVITGSDSTNRAYERIYGQKFRERAMSDPTLILNDISRLEGRPTPKLTEFDVTYMPTDPNRKPTIVRTYSGKQYLEVIDSLDRETLRKIRWNTEIHIKLDAIAEEVANNQADKRTRIVDIIDRLGLEDNKRNRKRIVKYNDEDHISLGDEGMVPEIAEELFPNHPKRQEIAKRYLWSIYRRYWSADQEYEDESLIPSDGSISRLCSGIELTLSDEEYARFSRKLLTETTIAERLFGDLSNGLKGSLKEKSLDEVLVEETNKYSGETVEFLAPMILKGKRKYHKNDTSDFEETLTKTKVEDKIRRGIGLRWGLQNFDAQRITVPDNYLTAQQVADSLHTTLEKVLTLDIGWEDAGMIKQVSEKMDVPYDELDSQYRAHFQDKVEGFTDDAVRFRILNASSLENISTQSFETVSVNTTEVNEELRRQYSIDGQEDYLFAAHLAPFKIGEEWLTLPEHNRELADILERKDDVRKRIEWSSELRRFYENPEEFTKYMKLDALKTDLGIGEEDWRKVKNYVSIENPGIESIKEKENRKQRKKKDKFPSPKEFDSKYFKGEQKKYVRISHAEEFKKKFIEGNQVAKIFTSVEASLDTLVEESKRQEVDISSIHAYGLNPKNKSEKAGEFYLKPEIRAAKKSLQKDTGYKRLQIALGLAAKLEEATTLAAEIKYISKDQATAELGITSTQLDKFIESEYLTARDVSAIPLLIDALKREYGVNIFENEIVDFCESDKRYLEVKRVTGITDITAFVENTKTVDSAKERVSGSGWLADTIFEYCAQRKSPTYLTVQEEKRIHISDIAEIESFQVNHMPIDVIRAAIAERLEVRKISRHYSELNGITRDTNKKQLEAITVKVEEFATQCYDKSKIESELGVRFANAKSIGTIMLPVIPGSMSFLDGKYYRSDIETLDIALDIASDELNVSKQRVIDYVESRDLSLCEDGLSEREIEKLISHSYSKKEIARISPKLEQRAQTEQQEFSYNEKTYCPRTTIQRFVMNNHLDDITPEGMNMLLRDDAWSAYMSKELNGEGRNNNNSTSKQQEIEEIIVEYILKDIGIKGEEGKYTGKDFKRLKTYVDMLQENGVHRINRFRTITNDEGLTVDSDTSFYTGREVINITGMRPAMITQTSQSLGISYTGNNETTLYSARDVAAIIKETRKNQTAWNCLTDPLETIMLSQIMNNGHMTALEPRLGDDGSLQDANPEEIGRLSHSLKIGNRLCYSKLNEVFSKVAYELGKITSGDKAQQMTSPQLCRIGANAFVSYMQKRS